MSRTYLITDRAEVDRRRRHLSGTIVEVWPDLYAGDVAWLGDPATRRVTAGQARAAPPGGRCWLSEDGKAGLDALGAPLPFVLAVPDAAVPIYYGTALTGQESLPAPSTLRARVLSAHGVGAVWATHDARGHRREPGPLAPTDSQFYLRRPGGTVAHLWHLVRTRGAGLAYVGEHLPGDALARRWAETLPAEGFDDLLARLAEPGDTAVPE